MVTISSQCKRSRRKRSVKHYMKEYEYSQEFAATCNFEPEAHWEETKNESEISDIEPKQKSVENVEGYQPKFEMEAKQTPRKNAMRSPLPHQLLKEKGKEDDSTLNIYNLSPSALEKRQKMTSRRDEIQDLEKSNLLPKLLDMNQKSSEIPNLPLLLNKSLSEGWDPFESVKRSLSNGTLQREKIFSKIKISEEVRIGGKAGSNFNPFVREEKTSHRTASTSYDSHNNEEQEVKSENVINTSDFNSKVENSQNLNRTQSLISSGESVLDQNLLEFLDNYSTDTLQKTALFLLEKSLARPKSFQVKQVPFPPQNAGMSSNVSEKESTNHEIISDDNPEFKPWNCRKSRCLKLYCECFSNGRKCTSKCDCSSCWNTHAHESLILKSKEQIMTRNPDAFKPKFVEDQKSKESKTKKHQRGCNCQKSNCLKKYWECFQKGVICSDLCRCVGCHNCGDAAQAKDSLLGK